ncbi:DNA helicase [Lasiodiplodia theobromae]|uniref:DNA helicase n=1 Tax=Lasiodiplodia theobromae TaxID=45133 RepID=UPI0015C39420|nr:DNA helicase [Lasiodiplodia theobromae]KAF4537400.1 DNA helicase [Lasiodiplodia theobromae]
MSSFLAPSAGRPPERPCALRRVRRPRLWNRSPAQVVPTLEVYADEDIEMERTGEDLTTSSKKIVSFENLPAARKFCEYSPGYIADTAYDMTLVHRDYRGRDRRAFRMRAKDKDGNALKGFNKKPFDAPRPACLEVSLVNGRSIVWGSLPGYEDVTEKSPITVIHRIDTQYPSMEIVVAPDPGDEHGEAITCIIYAEAIEAGLEADETLKGLWSAESHEFGDDYWNDYGAAFGYANGTDPAFKERQSWTTMVKIDSRRQSTPALPVPERSKVKFHGINPGRVEELRVQILEGSDVAPPADDPERLGFDPYEDLSYQELIIGFLTQGKCCVQIFTKVTLAEQYDGAYSEFIQYWLSLMKTSMTLGHFWYYRRYNREGTRLISHDFTIAGIEAPRWLATKFEVVYDTNDIPVSMVPSRWGTYRLPKVLIGEDCAFLVQLGSQRVLEHQNRLLSKYLTDREADCTMRFIANPHKDPQYLVQVNISESHDKNVIISTADARVILKIGGYFPGSRKNRDLELTGIVTDGYLSESCDFTVFCQGMGPNNLNDFIKGKIEIVNDITTWARQINATTIATDKQQTSGVDIGALLHLREPTVVDTAVVRKVFEENPEQQEVFDNVINSRQPSFNSSQREAAQKVTRSSTGLELIVGPPGTGKTDLGQTIVEGLAKCNYRVLVVATQHEAVDVAFRKFKSITTLPELQFSRWMRESPNYQQPSQFNAPVTTSAAETHQALPDDMWNKISTPGTSLDPEVEGYHAKFHTWVQEVAQQPGNPAYERATHYLDTLRSLGDPDLNSHDRRKLLDLADNLRTHDLAKAYLRSEVRVVFATCASSCSDTLFRFFQPQVVFVEEAGLASIADLAVPLAPYMESIKLVVMTGDQERPPPFLPSVGANEASDLLRRSLFKILLEDEKADHTELLTSYRTTGDLEGSGDRGGRGGGGGRGGRGGRARGRGGRGGRGGSGGGASSAA